jgi:hypothetical protein
MQAHLHMSFHARLSTAGSFKRHSANSLRTEHQCDCSARKLALGRTYTGRSFLEEEQHHRVSTKYQATHSLRLLSTKTRPLATTFRNASLLGQEGFTRTQQQTKPALLSRLKTMTLNVLILRWMKLIISLCVFPLLFLCDVFERGKFFGGYTMEMAYKEENAER